MSDEEIGKRIERLRRERNLSQQRLATMAGVSQTTIDKIEKGIIKRSKYLPEISKALNSPLHEIIEYPAQFEWKKPEFDVLERNRYYKANDYDSILMYGLKRLRSDDNQFMNDIGTSIFSQEPMGIKIRPPYLKEDDDAYCVMVGHDVMHPEFSFGDVAYLSPALPPMEETTCLFFGTGKGTSSVAVLAHLERLDEELWHLRAWGTNTTGLLRRAAFPTCHRVVAKTYPLSIRNRG